MLHAPFTERGIHLAASVASRGYFTSPPIFFPHVASPIQYIYFHAKYYHEYEHKILGVKKYRIKSPTPPKDQDHRTSPAVSAASSPS